MPVVTNGYMHDDNSPPLQHGVVLGQRVDDYIAGASPIPYEVRVEDGDWTPYLPPGEFQSMPPLDVMACVTFSALNSIECQYKLLTGEDRNFSDRFTACMSGTTQQGNFLWKVGDSIRRDGLVDEVLWPWQGQTTWEQYYTFPPTQVIDIGRTFLAEWEVRYEWVPVTPENLRYHLKQAPLQAVIPGHAVLHFYNEGDIQKYFDSYAPFKKKYDLPFLSALKLVLTKKKDMTEQEVRQLQALEGFSDPSGVLYWTGKPLADYLKARLVDKEKEIEFALGNAPEPTP